MSALGCAPIDERSASVSPQDLGPPSVQLAEFRMWFYDRHDGWIDMIAHYAGYDTSFWTTGSFRPTFDFTEEFFQFRDALVRFYESLSGEVALDLGDLNVRLKATDSLGHLEVRVEFGSSGLEGHWFKFWTDQSFLPPTIAQFESVLETFFKDHRLPLSVRQSMLRATD